MQNIVDELSAKCPKSRERYDESKRLFPDGVTHDARYQKPFPILMESAEGCRKHDIDGNEYIGYVMGHGSLLLGHNHPVVTRAVRDQLGKGTHLGASTENEIRWANAVIKLMPGIEKLRFTSSGTEATMMALRLARAFTGKNRIIKFSRHFHGWNDYLVAEPDARSSKGIPASVENLLVRLSPNNINLVDETLRDNRDIAGVIIEPTGARMGAFPVLPEFLHNLREVTRDRGVLLIFDEIVTGFRVSPGGAQQLYGIVPDLTALAKVLGGGLPGGAVGGRREILDLIEHRDDDVYDSNVRISHPGTYNANALSAAAGTACLDVIATTPVHQNADRAATRLKDGLNRVYQMNGVPGRAYGVASLVFSAFGVEGSSAEIANFFRLAMLCAGVDVMAGSRFIVSSVHTDDDIDETIAACEQSIIRLKREGVL